MGKIKYVDSFIGASQYQASAVSNKSENPDNNIKIYLTFFLLFL